MTKMQLLLVEDDTDLARLLGKYLRVQGFDVVLAGDSEVALALLAAQPFDIIVLDVMLPKGDGFSLADTIKRKHPGLPFLFLTARRQKEDVLKGLGLGADDYMVKPFDADELVLRVQNILRRSSVLAPPADRLIFGPFRFEPAQLRLYNGSTSVLLTKKEAGVLELLAQQPGRIVGRKEVLEKVWGTADYFNGRSLDVYIGRLRKLLEHESPIRIESIRGAGFILHCG